MFVNVGAGKQRSWSVLPLGRSFFFFFFISFFFYMMYSLFMVQELTCSTSYSVKKTFNPKQLHASSLHGKNETPTIHRKNPPRLAPKTIIPQTRKEIIHRDVQERDPNPSAGFPKTKETIDSRGPDRARG